MLGEATSVTTDGTRRDKSDSDDVLQMPTMSLPQLGALMGVSEPVIREQHRRGELEALGIRVLPLGRKYRVVTSTVRKVLGIDPIDALDSPS
jgi:hypothetical protein